MGVQSVPLLVWANSGPVRNGEIYGTWYFLAESIGLSVDHVLFTRFLARYHMTRNDFLLQLDFTFLVSLLLPRDSGS